MALVFHIGDQNHLPPVPAGFPKCGTWAPKPVQDLHSKIRKYGNGSVMLELSSNNENEFISYRYSNVANQRPRNPQHGNAMRKTASKLLINLILLLGVLL
ncbi:hypothetical protein Anas_13362 [Armadillidium nasatum]|uniref:Uncharacterized protein n=1 Tax=Armadillidium nasatum TaxID=96803 RepID=A0A5N5SWY0_9CRUS|nr:hypothetical protein Anas_13362 [Armadillidium nasatum]